MKFCLNRVKRGVWQEPVPTRNGRREEGFTMVEIALCLAIVGFAMVVIMGVLPIGSQVQKANREETLSLMDGNYLLEAIRNGARGYDDLGLYVDEILIYQYPNVPPVVLENNTSTGNLYWGTREIIGLISAPSFLLTSTNGWVPNSLNNDVLFNNDRTNLTCKLKLRSMNGTSADKGTDEVNRDFGMTYLVEVEVTPVSTNYMSISDIKNNPATQDAMLRERSMDNCTWQVSLKLGWPVKPSNTMGYKMGNNTQTFRTLISGSLNRSSVPLSIPAAAVKSGQSISGNHTLSFWYFDQKDFSVTNNATFYDDLAH